MQKLCENPIITFQSLQIRQGKSLEIWDTEIYSIDDTFYAKFTMRLIIFDWFSVAYLGAVLFIQSSEASDLLQERKKKKKKKKKINCRNHNEGKKTYSKALHCMLDSSN